MDYRSSIEINVDSFMERSIHIMKKFRTSMETARAVLNFFII